MASPLGHRADAVLLLTRATRGVPATSAIPISRPRSGLSPNAPRTPGDTADQFAVTPRAGTERISCWLSGLTTTVDGAASSTPAGKLSANPAASIDGSADIERSTLLKRS